MTERERIIDEMIDAMNDVDDNLRLPARLWNALAEAALSSLERQLPTDAVILPCTCGHNGYGQHMVGCELYGNQG
jgi:hypothetical protein